MGKIEGRPSYDIEVYVGAKGDVCIKQETDFAGEAIIIVHPDNIPALIDHLRTTYQEAMDFVPEPEKDEGT